MVSACVPLLECRETQIPLIFNTTPSYHHTESGNSEKETSYESAPAADEPVHTYHEPEPAHTYAEQPEPSHSHDHDLAGDHSSDYAPELNLQHSLDAPYTAPKADVPTHPESYDNELDYHHYPSKQEPPSLDNLLNAHKNGNSGYAPEVHADSQQPYVPEIPKYDSVPNNVPSVHDLLHYGGISSHTDEHSGDLYQPPEVPQAINNGGKAPPSVHDLLNHIENYNNKN